MMCMDVVLVQVNPFDEPVVCFAPAFCSLKQGDLVQIDDDREGYVEIKTTVNMDSEDELPFLLYVTHASLPLPRILSVVTSLKYEEEQNESDNS